jgi:hypothetical protein
MGVLELQAGALSRAIAADTATGLSRTPSPDRLRSVYDALHKCPSPRRAARGNDPKNGQRDIRHYLLLALAEVSGKPMVRMRLIVVAGLRRLA